ncbi:cyclic di-GMP phosphodiesterase response regulator RpfG [Clostridium acetireducens DSM 10703]|uniref:Cyclic di-GMP phosphodiesterase response regulator RpfG n=1 Tax=Clostridium acetireducens DSM 10703 TaxID=1121290 RepID=A0A1E8EYA9_9CLOT|nr:HD-GYP domain-containing protein [Clostridium acetireducens]OFI05935.1 cyclic di-GMP phosphodiesterase response regulator RpfG [Clostridium acetireducens DSM 10703]
MGNNKKVKINVNDLKTGMIAAEDIVVDGSTLVIKGLEINENIIKKLKEFYFQRYLLVYHEFENEYYGNKSHKKEMEDVEISVEKFTKSVKCIFDAINSNGKTDIEEVRNFSKKIMDEINSPSLVVKNIVLHGSGKDSIFKHSINVATLSFLLGKWIGLDKSNLNLLVYAAVLHDFGKSKIDSKILHKSTKLTEEEIEEIKRHPIIGYNIVKDIPYLSTSVSYGILMHHERLDGSGYPLGLKDKNIHDFAKIIAIADTFDAVNSSRVHKKSIDPFGALEIIQKSSLGKLHYIYSKIFIEHIINYYIGEYVMLNDNRVCKIIQVDINNLSKPLLLYDGDFIDLKNRNDLYVKKLVLNK